MTVAPARKGIAAELLGRLVVGLHELSDQFDDQALVRADPVHGVKTPAGDVVLPAQSKKRAVVVSIPLQFDGHILVELPRGFRSRSLSSTSLSMTDCW